MEKNVWKRILDQYTHHRISSSDYLLPASVHSSSSVNLPPSTLIKGRSWRVYVASILSTRWAIAVTLRHARPSACGYARLPIRNVNDFSRWRPSWICLPHFWTIHEPYLVVFTCVQNLVFECSGLAWFCKWKTELLNLLLGGATGIINCSMKSRQMCSEQNNVKVCQNHANGLVTLMI